jgi:hypothetical protein
MRWLAWVLLAASVYGAWHWWSTERDVTRAPGVLVTEDPRQQDLEAPRKFAHKGFELSARARYDITARVLRKEIYRIDGGAGLAPVDLGVGWGPMSDTAIVERLEFSQMGRFFYWKPLDASFPLSRQMLITHAAQMHMVPADDAIERHLKRIRPGHIVTIGGWLVDIRGANGFVWSTSLRRDDTGGGACEIVYIESLDVR